MKGHSKIKLTGYSDSRYVDISDFAAFTKAKEPNSKKPPKTPRSNHINNTARCSFPEYQTRNVQVLGAAHLHRNSSGYAPQSKVKRAFSLERSSSVSERYSRIHDKFGAVTKPFYGEESVMARMERTKSLRKNSGKILKVCKRLFGL